MVTSFFVMIILAVIGFIGWLFHANVDRVWISCGWSFLAFLVFTALANLNGKS
jgi:hypothetical protein